ncbi:hypothetical protein C8R45DRAFT_1067962 [Mycena sanguinolenta]|nr:hypothetical protein C8R45DRAFT_1067962 [Mycena sanguinolenta]
MPPKETCAGGDLGARTKMPPSTPSIFTALRGMGLSLARASKKSCTHPSRTFEEGHRVPWPTRCVPLAASLQPALALYTALWVPRDRAGYPSLRKTRNLRKDVDIPADPKRVKHCLHQVWLGSGASRMAADDGRREEEPKRMCHTVTQDSTIPKQVVSLFTKVELLFLKTDKNMLELGFIPADSASIYLSVTASMCLDFKPSCSSFQTYSVSFSQFISSDLVPKRPYHLPSLFSTTSVPLLQHRVRTRSATVTLLDRIHGTMAQYAQFKAEIMIDLGNYARTNGRARARPKLCSTDPYMIRVAQGPELWSRILYQTWSLTLQYPLTQFVTRDLSASTATLKSSALEEVDPLARSHSFIQTLCPTANAPILLNSSHAPCVWTTATRITRYKESVLDLWKSPQSGAPVLRGAMLARGLQEQGIFAALRSVISGHFDASETSLQFEMPLYRSPIPWFPTSDRRELKALDTLAREHGHRDWDAPYPIHVLQSKGTLSIRSPFTRYSAIPDCTVASTVKRSMLTCIGSWARWTAVLKRPASSSPLWNCRDLNEGTGMLRYGSEIRQRALPPNSKVFFQADKNVGSALCVGGGDSAPERTGDGSCGEHGANRQSGTLIGDHTFVRVNSASSKFLLACFFSATQTTPLHAAGRIALDELNVDVLDVTASAASSETTVFGLAIDGMRDVPGAEQLKVNDAQCQPRNREDESVNCGTALGTEVTVVQGAMSVSGLQEQNRMQLEVVEVINSASMI